MDQKCNQQLGLLPSQHLPFRHDILTNEIMRQIDFRKTEGSTLLVHAWKTPNTYRAETEGTCSRLTYGVQASRRVVSCDRNVLALQQESKG